MRSGVLRRSLEIGAILLILLVGHPTLAAAAQRAPFNGDEGQYTCTSRYFAYLFLEHDVTRDEWGENYWTHTQPMLVRYILGAQFWLHGYNVREFESYCDFDWTLTREENRRLGRVPDETLLATARAPMLLFALLGLLAVYGLGRVLGGIVAGLTSAALLLASPLSQLVLVEALPEAVLILTMVTSGLVAFVGMRRAGAGSLPWRWAVVTGMVAGLGLATKLTAVLGLAALGVWGALVAVVAFRQGPPASGRRTRARLAWRAGRGWLLAVALGLLVFVASDPYTYPNPVRRTGTLFLSRAREMRTQQELVKSLAGEFGAAQTAVYGSFERIGYVLERSLVSNTATGSRGQPIEAALAIAGMGVVLSRMWRTWQHGRRLAPEGLILTITAVYFVGTMAFLGLDWSRYYLPTLTLGCVLSGVATSAAARRILAGRLTLYPRAPVSEGTGAT